MHTSRTTFGAFWILTALLAAGCGKTNDAPLPAASSTPTPAPRLGVVVEGSRFAWSDKAGDRVADITAATGAAAGTGEHDAVGAMNKARAILYQKNKPVATLTADKLEPDTKTQTITGTGNVRLVSNGSSDRVVSTLRADRMTWEYERDKIHGAGNVLVTQGNMARIPGSTIDADTTLRTVKITGSTAPITGRIP